MQNCAPYEVQCQYARHMSRLARRHCVVASISWSFGQVCTISSPRVVCVKFADYEFSLGSCICAGNPETHTAVPQHPSKEVILHFTFIVFKIFPHIELELDERSVRGYLEKVAAHMDLTTFEETSEGCATLYNAPIMGLATWNAKTPQQFSTTSF